MRKSTLLAAVVAAAAAAIITPSISQAQDTTQKTSKGEVAMAPSFGSLISAINAASAQNGKIKALTEVNAANVQLVNVEDLLKGQNAEALTKALTKNEADITALRTTLGANAGLASVLTANSVPLAPTDVVAADVGADGKIIVYYWKKPA